MTIPTSQIRKRRLREFTGSTQSHTPRKCWVRIPTHIYLVRKLSPFNYSIVYLFMDCSVSSTLPSPRANTDTSSLNYISYIMKHF